MKTICICEKPSVARSIARVLGVTEKQEGYRCYTTKTS